MIGLERINKATLILTDKQRSCTIWYLKGAGHKAPATRRRPQGAGHKAPATRRRPQGAGHKAPATRRRPQGAGQKASVTRRRSQGVGHEGFLVATTCFSYILLLSFIFFTGGPLLGASRIIFQAKVTRFKTTESAR